MLAELSEFITGLILFFGHILSVSAQIFIIVLLFVALWLVQRLMGRVMPKRKQTSGVKTDGRSNEREKT